MAYSDGYAGGYGGGGIPGDPFFEYQSVPWGNLDAVIYSLEVGRDYEISVAAYDHAGRTSGFSTPVTVSTAADTTAPSQPAPPTLIIGVLEITVAHTLGLASGGSYNLPNDLAELEIHQSLSSGFTADASTKVSALKADNANLVSQTPVVISIPVTDTATRYFKVIAVDRSGNRSTPSSEVSGSPTLIGSTQIINRAIQGLDIALDAITEELIAGRSIFARHLYVADFDNLIFNAGAEASTALTPHAPHSSASGGGIWSVDATYPRTGLRSFKYDTVGQSGKARLVLNVEDGDAASNPDSLIAVSEGQWLVAIAEVRSEFLAVANDAGVAIVWYDAALSVISEVEQLKTDVTNTYGEVEVMAQAPANTAHASVELRVANESNANPIHFDDLLLRRALEGKLIVDGTIEGNHLAVVTIEVDRWIQSDNFVTGVSGWIIEGDGNAEFNDLLLRGDVSGNWNGADPADLTSGPDPAASTGYYLDSSAGAAQFEGAFYIGGNLDVTGTGSFRAGDPAGGEYIEISGNPFSSNSVLFHHSGLDQPGFYSELGFAQGGMVYIRPGYDNATRYGQLVVGSPKSLPVSGGGFDNPGKTLLFLGEQANGDFTNRFDKLLQVEIGHTDTVGLRITGPSSLTEPLLRASAGGVSGNLEIRNTGLHTEMAKMFPSMLHRLPADFSPASASTFEVPDGSPDGTIPFTHVVDAEVRVEASASVQVNQVSGSATEVRARLRISLDNGSTWNAAASGPNAVWDRGLATGERITLNPIAVLDGTMTDNILVELQVFSTSTNTSFENMLMKRTIWGTTTS